MPVLASMLDQWSGEGLRTLVMGARELSQEEYALWKQRYDAANASINNRQALVADAANELERNLQLVGATAIEDQLQDNVPDTIAYLREAGVKVRAQPTARGAAEGCAKTGLTRVRCVCVCRCGC